VIELRFSRELYDLTSVDEAVQTFAGHASLERLEEPTQVLVRITGKDAARERRIAGELGNFALGLTIKSSRGAS